MKTIKKSEYQTKVNVTDFILRDHLVHSTHIMPGVVFLDIACRMLEQEKILPETIELKNIFFKEAVAVSGNIEKLIRITLEPDETLGGCQSVIKAGSQYIKNGIPLHSHQSENFSSDLFFNKSALSGHIDIDDLKRRAVNIVDMDTAYASIRSMDISHHIFMKATGSIFLGEDYALAEIGLSDPALDISDMFFIHPVFLDAASIVSFFFNYKRQAVGKPYIPIHIASFRAGGALRQRCFIYVKKRKQTSHSNDVIYMDMALYNERGEIAVLIKKMAAKRIRSEGMIRELLNEISEEECSGRYELLDGTDHQKPSRSSEDLVVQPDSGPKLITSQNSLGKRIEDELRLMFAALADKPLEEVDTDKGFYDLGFDSSHLLQMARTLEKKIGKELYPTLLFEYPTFGELARYIEENHPERFQRELKHQPADNKAGRNNHHPERPLKRKDKKPLKTDDIAIIGLAGRYPLAEDIRRFWDRVASGEDCISEIPETRWCFHSYYSKLRSEENTIHGKWGGFLSGVEHFDPLFFSISPKEARYMDPQVCLMLETAWHAVEDAGYTRQALEQTSVGVYAGVMNDDHTWVASENFTKTGVYTSPGSYAHDIANRISYALDCHGPSLTVETACASSLTAIHLARCAIINHECELALAGGVNLSLHPSKYLMLSDIQILSPEGKEKTFDESADGYVPGEGVGMVLLKQFSKAVSDRDHIYGIIKGSSMTHAGRGAGYMVPNIRPLSGAVEKALEKSGIHPDRISYIEAHGTGTRLGDPVEIRALASAFEKHTERKGFCALGTKANMGHMESASGICSVTKVLMALKHNTIPACSNISKINQTIQLEQSPFYIPKKALPWKQENSPRVAGINSFGIGGSNCFVLIEDYCKETTEKQSNFELQIYLIVLSAKKINRLKSYASNLSLFLKEYGIKEMQADPNYLLNLAFTLQVGREAMCERLAIIAESLDVLIEVLGKFIDDDDNDKRIMRGCVKNQVSHFGELDKKKLDVAIDEKNIPEIGRLWLTGASIPWEGLYEDVSPCRVSAPGYPFEKRDCRFLGADLSNPPVATLQHPIKVAAEDKVYARAVWEQEDAKTGNFLPKLEEVILVFENESDFLVSGALRSLLPSGAPYNILRIESGNTFKEVGKNNFIIRPANWKDYERLFHLLNERGCLPDHIIHGWSFSFWSGSDSIGDLEPQFEKSVYSLIGLVKSIATTQTIRSVGLVYLTPRQLPCHTAITSLLRTIRLETSKCRFKVIEIENPSVLKTALKEFNEIQGAIHICYDANQVRKVKLLERFIPPRVLSGNLKSQDGGLKQDGVYLITGGAGGLGRIMMAHISNRVRAKLVLSGRSSLGIEERNTLSALLGPGSEFIYIKSDISLKDESQDLIKQVKARYGRIDGIIHCAGVVRDALLLRKEKKEIEAVLRPKIHGTIFLDEATKDESLEFFVLFSSISALSGNIGQCDYAYANGFMDQFAELREELRKKERRFGKTVSINWPLWKEGTMTVDEETLAMAKSKLGVQAMETATGIEAFELGLVMDHTSFTILEGDSGKILSSFAITTPPPDKKHDASQREAQGDLKARIETEVVKMVCRLLEVESEDIDLYESISEYGFDSIALTRFAEMISKAFDLNITPDIFYEHPSIGSLTHFLFERYPQHLLKSQKLSTKNGETTSQQSVDDKNKRSYLGPEDNLFHEPVAVIGISGRMPQSEDLSSFWKHLEDGDNLITEIPEDRWDWRRIYGDPAREPGKTHAKWGGFISDVDKFDAGFFNISPREAELMDPQQRLFIETVWNVIEDAGYKASDFWGKDVGVFVGIATRDYADMLQNHQTEISPHISTGIAHTMAANRVSYFFNFTGPSEPVDTACSSSLVAILRAVSYLREGKGRIAIAGGVNIMLNPMLSIAFSSAGMLCKDGRCKTFDKDANGYVRGEGVGAVLLKPLKDAEEDKDFIYGIIKGGAINHGGRASSLTAPNTEAQALLLTEAYSSSGIHPSTLTYIEAHGTGTKLGDPVEINGLRKFLEAFQAQGEKELSKKIDCALGSVKTNIGHLEAAAGIASTLKVLLSMKHKKIPAHLHLKETNPFINLEGTGFYINKKTRPWNCAIDGSGKKIPRRAGISSFGFGGTNAHVIFEAYDGRDTRAESRNDQLIILSAKTKMTLESRVRDLIAFIEKEKETLLIQDIAFTLRAGREAMEERFAVVASCLDDLLGKLLAFYTRTGTGHGGFLTGSVKKKRSGSQTSMGKALGTKTVPTGDLSSLGAAWVSGETINWEIALGSITGRRIPLPGYSFERNRYWIPKTKQRSSGQHSFHLRNIRHPLIDRVNSTSTSLYFEKHLKGNELYIQDHVIKGECVLPAAVCLEMARAAGEFLDEKGAPLRLRRIVWSKPAFLNKKNQTLQIKLVPDRGGHQFTIASLSDSNDGNFFSQGSLVSLTETEPPQEHLDINAITKRCEKVMRKKECYEFFESKDVRYGPFFQAIETLYMNRNESFSRLVSPELEEMEQKGWVLNPSIMDGALQTVVGMMDQNINPDNNRLLLPYSMEEIIIFGRLPDRGYAYVEQSDNWVDEESIAYDIQISDDSGTVIVCMKTVVFRPLGRPKEVLGTTVEGKPAVHPAREETQTDKIQEIEALLVIIAAKLLKVEQEAVVVEEDMGDLGFDSFLFTRFANQLSDQFGLDIKPTLFYEYPSIQSLADLLAQKGNVSFDETHQIDQSLNAVDSALPDSSVSLEKDNVSVQEPIAIIGMNGILPGSDDLTAFWQHLENGDVLITGIPKERPWLKPRSAGNDWDDPFIRYGGFIDRVDTFDADFFKISPMEAEWMDPQQRLLLEVAWKTIEEAGYRVSDLSGAKIGVFVGASSSDYYELAIRSEIEPDGLLATGNAHAIMANRVSTQFNFIGPSETIDTACSSSSVAIHRAICSMYLGECNMAIAAGVNLLLSSDKFTMFGKLGLLSRDGNVRTFDKNANGYVRGEGIGAVLLKPFLLAQKEGNHIHALIRGSAVNHGGKGRSLISPNPSVQAETIIDAYKKAGINPATVSYIETQGTGTAIGDPLEVNAIKHAFDSPYFRQKNDSLQKARCGLGSVKPNIGHLESASGMASLFKVILSIKHRILPSTVRFNELNQYIDINKTPFYIVDKTCEWKALNDDSGHLIPRRAGINAFGFGGSNSHMVVEEYLPDERLPIEVPVPELFVFSARKQEHLNGYLLSMKQFLEDVGQISLKDTAFTLQCGREAMPSRAAVMASNKRELIDKIDALLRMEDNRCGIFTKERSQKSLCQEMNDPDTGENMPSLHGKDLEALATQWVCGTNIDWRLLYEQNDRKRLSLPVRPLVSSRYWLTFKTATVPEPMQIKAIDSHNSKNSEDSCQTDIQENIIQWVARFIKRPAVEIDVNCELHNYGFNSLTGMRLINRIQDVYGLRLSVQALFDCTTLHDLTRYVGRHLEEKRSVRLSITKQPQDTTAYSPPTIPEPSADLHNDKFFEILIEELAAGSITPEEATYLEERLFSDRA